MALQVYDFYERKIKLKYSKTIDFILNICLRKGSYLDFPLNFLFILAYTVRGIKIRFLGKLYAGILKPKKTSLFKIGRTWLEKPISQKYQI